MHMPSKIVEKVSTESSGISALTDALSKFISLQKKYATFGAFDSEVNETIMEIMIHANADEIPNTREEWALYENAPPKVIEALHNAAVDIVSAILNSKWRVDVRTLGVLPTH